ncbi:KH domain-containing protein [Syntrophomonas wolfei]|uniref:KH domain-containing protein n=1 Tax=Syntrophomonas wolfei TaxID=863 RepID=UPI0023F1AA32|nr:KH domain-containing protein [Syntrophomonas wolfei]
MKELVEHIAKSLVDNPEQVEVRESEGERSIVLELKVAADDMGKVIGKQGKIAKAIRTLTKATAAKEGKRVAVEIVKEG